MNDVSVEYIGSLYDYCHSAETFLNDIESATKMIISNLDVLAAESNVHISKIQEVLEHYKSELDQIYTEIDYLKDRLAEVETYEEDDHEARMEILDEIKYNKMKLAEFREKYKLCKNDLYQAKELQNAIANKIYTIILLAEESKTIIKTDTESSISFIKKYISYLQDIISNKS